MEEVLILQMVILCLIIAANASNLGEIAGLRNSPPPSTFSAFPPVLGTPGSVQQEKSLRINGPSSAPQQNGPLPDTIEGFIPSASPHAPPEAPPFNSMPQPSLPVQPNAPLISPSAPEPEGKAPANETPLSIVSPGPAVSSSNSPHYPPTSSPHEQTNTSSSSHQSTSPNVAPIPEPISPASKLPKNSPASHPVGLERPPSILPEPIISPAIAISPKASDRKRLETPAATPYNALPKYMPPVNHSPGEAPSSHNDMGHSHDAQQPISPPQKTLFHRVNLSPTSPPSPSNYKNRRRENHIISHAPGPSYPISSPMTKTPGPVISTAQHSPGRQHHAPPSESEPPSHYAPLPPVTHVSPSPSPHQKISGHTRRHFYPPKASPSKPWAKSPKMPPIHTLPPPPPDEDCLATQCTEPYTNTPPGSPCGCVWPMQIGLRLSVSLYTFFPLVSVLATEIAAGVFVKQSQVRIIGANAANQQPDKTVVLIDLVPLGEKFDNTTAFLTYQRFWHKKVSIRASYFGNYEVLYVRYPGLPQSPPSGDSGLDNEPYFGNSNDARAVKPIGVDVQNRQHKDRLSGGMIAIVALSTTIAVVLCVATAWILLFKRNDGPCQPKPTPNVLLTSLNKPSGAGGSVMATMPSSASLSFGSSIAPYSGSAKTFSASDIEKATNNFDPSRILGEGGFGRVYRGVLEDGTEVAVKVLKRDDHQGGREFLAEVEMLSRLHHRNLVKLIGICIEERSRSLVYELIPNGSVESHLHGFDKETAPLDWEARIKIALGAARGLSYLHEDSSPRVIHRDFKSSNILLEHDFTPKVSDFGLARTAMDEESRHISTRVMGTFGYVAPEYAMTGHLLVKSDVYSYGVVLLELLTGRKPVDMSQPPGEENLVAWARPLLTSKEGIDVIIDKSIDSNVPFENIAKVAAIASMCVQPEVSHRPFMGEVVQALKLVCNQCNKARETSSQASSSPQNSTINTNDDEASSSRYMLDSFHSEYLVPNSISSLYGIDTRLSISDLLNTSMGIGMQESRQLERCFSSGPPRIGKGKRHFWERMRRYSGSSISEHGMPTRIWSGST
ncbi:receptor-like serine/threonine-protein kinase ALE2 isoform X2 [Benincasa hispida]|uniref:receptor-like serine/threonine-protein kinase ALE2 isoform X2 n=1 Tax=Benincasa hispida TaxID=102211 RepID=UPI0018FF2C09|nr:receptor-like serine/threonine-protein kinase ALE2 isoform X2 [Benincasa hispida]